MTDYEGLVLSSDLGRPIDAFLRGELLAKILRMPSQSPISYSDAILKLNERMRETWEHRNFGHKPGQSQWYWRNFVEFISAQGFHIELTGDEFELWHPPRVDS